MQKPERKTFEIEDMKTFREKALLWADKFNNVHYLQNNNIQEYPFGGFRNILAVGAIEGDILQAVEGEDTFKRLQQFYEEKKYWIFGYLGYDLKNEIENLKSENADGLEFPAAYFYVPQNIIFFHDKSATIQSFSKTPEKIWREIWVSYEDDIEKPQTILINPIRPRVSKEEYISAVKKLKNHILEGDIYEVNYCMEFYSDDSYIRATEVYEALNELSPMPFSSFVKIQPNKYLISASPERFLQKKGNQLISQPIKGTAKRGKNADEDQLMIEQLRNSEKEMAENMMIVDLVRNDLARSAKTGSVKVHEMFGIYTFQQLHQMISTITAEVKEGISISEILKNAFPMGSMTGAPKIRAMELIESHEATKRGLYSGAVGYISPEGDFDFNVVIRGIQFNHHKNYVSFMVGSAITHDADPEKEYEECLLKAESMRKVLEETTRFRPYYDTQKPIPDWIPETVKFIYGNLFYGFLANKWVNSEWLVFNKKTILFSGIIFGIMLGFYWGFKKIEYWKSTKLNVFHNWVSHLLNGPAAVSYLGFSYVMIILAIIFGFFYTFYRWIFPEDVSPEKLNSDYRKKHPIPETKEVETPEL